MPNLCIDGNRYVAVNAAGSEEQEPQFANSMPMEPPPDEYSNPSANPKCVASMVGLTVGLFGLAGKVMFPSSPTSSSSSSDDYKTYGALTALAVGSFVAANKFCNPKLPSSPEPVAEPELEPMPVAERRIFVEPTREPNGWEIIAGLILLIGARGAISMPQPAAAGFLLNGMPAESEFGFGRYDGPI